MPYGTRGVSLCLTIMLLICAYVSCTDSVAKGSANHAIANNLSAVLSGVDNKNPASLATAENELVAMGKNELPTLISAQHTALGAQKAVLTVAIFRLTYGIDPHKLITERISKTTGSCKAPLHEQTTFISYDSLQHVFPSRLFYVVRFTEWPSSIKSTGTGNRTNIFSVNSNGTVDVITDRGSLQKFFGQEISPIRNDDIAKDLVACWLRLSPELSHSGPLHFSIPKDAISLHRDYKSIRASGKALVDPLQGAHGEIGVTFTFTASGELQEVHEASALELGKRPY